MDDPSYTAVRHFHRFKTLGSATAGAVLVAGLAAGCNAGGGGGGNANASGPITICEIAATSGPFSVLGTNDELGATAWADMVNKAGGILGHKVKLVPENDGSDPATAAGLVRKCVTEVHANFIFGPEETATTSAAVPIANSLKEVLIGWQSGWKGQGISDANLHSYSFPGIGDVFLADDLATITQIIAPRHYTRVAVIQDNSPGGLPNSPYMVSQGQKYGYSVVSTQVTQPGATDDTPQALNMLKANPQIIVLGMTPGPDTITAIKAIRAQDPNIPISECSGCATSTFISAVGGQAAMKNIYLIGTPENVLSVLPNSGANATALADTRAYIAAMQGAGMGSPTQIDEGGEGWDTGRELAAAITTAKSIDTNAVKNALEHQTLVTGGIQCYFWQRSPSDYSNITQIQSAVVTAGPNDTFTVLPHVGG